MRSFFTILLFFLSVVAFGQNHNSEDVVYLKNGNIVKGKIMELHTDSILKIKISGGSLFVFNIREIDKIESKKEAINNPQPNAPFSAPMRIGARLMVGPSIYRTVLENGYGIVKSETSAPKFSFGCGASFEYRPVNRIGFEAELLYFAKVDFYRRYNYLILPVHCLIYFGQKPTSFFFNFGFYPGCFLMSSDKKVDPKVINRTVLGLNAGLGFYGVRFNVSWEPTNMLSRKELTSGEILKITSIHFMLSYAYKFKLETKQKINK